MRLQLLWSWITIFTSFIHDLFIPMKMRIVQVKSRSPPTVACLKRTGVFDPHLAGNSCSFCCKPFVISCGRFVCLCSCTMTKLWNCSRILCVAGWRLLHLIGCPTGTNHLPRLHPNLQVGVLQLVGKTMQIIKKTIQNRNGFLPCLLWTFVNIKLFLLSSKGLQPLQPFEKRKKKLALAIIAHWIYGKLPLFEKTSQHFQSIYKNTIPSLPGSTSGRGRTGFGRRAAFRSAVSNTVWSHDIGNLESFLIDFNVVAIIAKILNSLDTWFFWKLAKLWRSKMNLSALLAEKTWCWMNVVHSPPEDDASKTGSNMPPTFFNFPQQPDAVMLFWPLSSCLYCGWVGIMDELAII